MRNIFMLAAANIRKRKSQSISLLIFVLIAAMFLYIGLMLYFGYASAFDDRAEELNAPHLVILQDERIMTDEQFEWLTARSTETERHSAISTMGEFYSNGTKSPAYIIFANADAPQSMNPPSLIGESLPLADGSVYVPYIMKASAGYELGDNFTVTLLGSEITYTVAGFTEDLSFGSFFNQFYRLYVNGSDYEILNNDFAEIRCFLTTSRFVFPEESTLIQAEYVKEFFFFRDIEDMESVYLMVFDYDVMKTGRVMIPMIIAMIVTVFAFILLAVCLIVMRFGIINNIDESMVNIGVMKAVGYSNLQIVNAFLLQFGGISAVGGLLGLGASALLIPALSSLLESQSAMIWNPGIHMLFAAVTLFAVIFAVILVSFLTVKRIFRLHPLVALRGGIQTHNFKKNNMPLDKSYGELSFLLAMKQLAKSRGQSLMIALIIVAVSFASVAVIALYYTIGVNTDKFISTMVGELPDAAFALKDRGDTEDFVNRLREHTDVRKAFGYQSFALMAGDDNTTGHIVEDCAFMEGSMLIDGWYPQHDNEIAVSNGFMRIMGKTIGDTVTIRQGSHEADYLITGQVQTIMNSINGNIILMNSDALKRVQPNFVFDQIYVYLNAGTDITSFIESIEAAEGDILTNTVNFNELAENQFGSFSDIFGAVAAVILLITVVIVVLVLYLVIKTTILRRKREFGIQKALGFTTLQIMNQISLHFLPVIAVGVILGGIGGFYGLNPIFIAMVSDSGIAKSEFSAPVGWSVITCIALIALAYVVSMLIAWRIRKISAYSLITE